MHRVARQARVGLLFEGEAIVEGFADRLDREVDRGVAQAQDLPIDRDGREAEALGVHLGEWRHVARLPPAARSCGFGEDARHFLRERGEVGDRQVTAHDPLEDQTVSAEHGQKGGEVQPGALPLGQSPEESGQPAIVGLEAGAGQDLHQSDRLDPPIAVVIDGVEEPPDPAGASARLEFVHRHHRV